MWTTLANQLTRELASKMGLHCLFLGRSLNSSLQTIKEHLQELLYVHLLEHVRWLAFPVFEGVAEALRVDVLLF